MTSAVTAPVAAGFIGGLSAAVSFGASNRLESSAVPKRVVALHVSIAHGAPWSASTQIGALRHLLAGGGEGETKEYFAKAIEVTLLSCVVPFRAWKLTLLSIGRDPAGHLCRERRCDCECH